MKKLTKKGFTLIEVLGVIIVLAVIALITVPLVTKIINDSRRNSFKISANSLVEAANNYYADNQLKIDKTITFDFKNGGKAADGTELAYSGPIPIQGRIVLNQDGGVILIDISDGKYYANYDSTGDDAVIVTDDNIVLTRDELTEAVKRLTTEVETLKTKKFDKSELLDKTYPVGSVYTSIDNTNPSTIYGGTWVAFGTGRTLVGVDADDSAFNTVEKKGGSKNESITLTTSNLPSHNHSIPSLGGGTNSVGDHSHYIPSLSGSTNTSGNHTHSYVNSYGNGSEYAVPGNVGGNNTFNSSYPYTQNAVSIAYAGNHTHSLSTNATYTGGSGSHAHSVSTNASTTGDTGSGSSINVNKLDPYITVYMWKRTK